MSVFQTAINKNMNRSGLIASDLKILDDFIKESIYEPESILISDIANYIVCAGGKRIRPQILILLAKLFAYSGFDHIKLAAAIELIHTATLLHDDVIDNSDLRRNKATAHVKWGVRSSITVGDWLFARAFKLVTECNNNELIQIIAGMTKNMTKGELDQLYFKNKPKQNDYNEQHYINIIKAKTGLLFEASCELAAVLTRQSEQIIENTKLFGLHLGLAFQIKDDLLDYLGTSQELGKNIGDDLLEGKLTLPLIYLKQRNIKQFNFYTQQLVQLRENFDAAEFNKYLYELIQVLKQFNCISDSCLQADYQQQLALQYLSYLPNNQYSQYLEQMTKNVTMRSS